MNKEDFRNEHLYREREVGSEPVANVPDVSAEEKADVEETLKLLFTAIKEKHS